MLKTWCQGKAALLSPCYALHTYGRWEDMAWTSAKRLYRSKVSFGLMNYGYLDSSDKAAI